MDIFLYILSRNIVPIFLMIAAGFILAKKFTIDVYSLSKLNFYIFIPAFMFVNLFTANLDWAMMQVVVFGIVILIAYDLVGLVIAKIRNFEPGLTNAFKTTIMFNNCGNIGISLITLIFSGDPYIVDGKTPYLDTALAALIMTLLLQIIVTNTLGFFYAGRAKFNTKELLINIFSMPTIYVAPLVIILKLIGFDMKQTTIWPALESLSYGLVPMALVTLGVQLSHTQFSLKDSAVHLAVFARLIIGPVLAIACIYFFGFYGIIAQAIFIAYAAPTAVNVALIAVECDNFPDFSAQTVMASTIFSAVTLTFAIYIARVIYPI